MPKKVKRVRKWRAWAWIKRGQLVERKSKQLYIMLEKPKNFCLCREYSLVEIREVRR